MPSYILLHHSVSRSVILPDPVDIIIIHIYIYITPYITIYYHISPTQTRVNGHHMKPSHGGIADGWERRGTGADREADVHGIPWHYVFNMFKKWLNCRKDMHT